jgi:hypothetical protein
MTSPNRGPSRGPKNNLSLSMILGTLLVPVSAVAAIWLTDPGQPAQAETVLSTTTTAAPAASTAAQVSFTDSGATEADLRAACGYVGMTLVDAERDGSISDVQQAALDALRDICDEQGLSLPAPPTPDEQVQTVVVQADSSAGASAASSSGTSTVSNSSSQHESEHESEHEDEHEHEDGGVDG